MKNLETTAKYLNNMGSAGFVTPEYVHSLFLEFGIAVLEELGEMGEYAAANRFNIASKAVLEKAGGKYKSEDNEDTRDLPDNIQAVLAG